MKVVYKNFTLGAIEENLKNLTKDCEIWADLELSYEEYTILNDKMRQALRGKRTVLSLQKRYPLVSITHAVNFIVYNEYENFWQEYSAQLERELDGENREILSGNYKLILEQLGFNKAINIFEEKEKSLDTIGVDNSEADIMPILCQVGIPNTDLQYIFDVVQKNGINNTFDLEGIFSQMTCKNYYAVSSATKVHINLYKERATKFFLNINNLINTGEESIDEKKYNPEFIAKFDEWKIKSRYQGKMRLWRTAALTPHISYDYDEKQFDMVIPSWAVKDCYVQYIKYKITDSEYRTQEGRILVRGDGQGRYIKQHKVPIEASKAYMVHLFYNTDENKPIIDKKMTGPLGEKPVIFDCNGEKISEMLFQDPEFIQKNTANSNSGQIILNNIRYKEEFGKSGKAIIYWDAQKNYSANYFVLKQLNNGDFSEIIQIRNIRKLKASSGEKHYISLKQPLESGIYKICTNGQISEGGRYTPEKFDGINTFKYRAAEYKENVGSLEQIVSTVLMNYDVIKMLQKIKTIVKKTGDQRDLQFSERACQSLIVLICSFCEQDKPSDNGAMTMSNNYRNCSILIEEIVKLIDKYMLNGEIRGFILQKISNYNLSKKQLETCFNILNLRVSRFRNSQEIAHKDLERIAELSDMTAMRMSLANPMNYDRGIDLLRLAGYEALQEFFRFEMENKNIVNWMEKYEAFLRGELPKGEENFHLALKVVGNQNVFNDIINWGLPEKHKNVEDALAEKQFKGRPFCGRFYPDLLVAWYMRCHKALEKRNDLEKKLAAQALAIDGIYMTLEPRLTNTVLSYERALRCRLIEGRSVFSNLYYCGLASIIISLDNIVHLEPNVLKICEDFLRSMNKIIPELVERDLLIANMYVLFNNLK